MRLRALQKKRQDLIAEGRRLADTLDAAASTDEQKAAARTRRDAILAELDTLNADIAAEQRLLEAERAQIVRGAGEPTSQVEPDENGECPEGMKLGDDGMCHLMPPGGNAARARVGLVADERDRIAGAILQAIGQSETGRRLRSRRLSRFAAAAGFEGPAPFGEFLAAVARAGTPGGHIDPRLMAAATGGAASVPGEGGFLIRSVWSTILLDRAREASKLLPRTTTIPIGEGFDSFEAPYLQQTDRSQASTRFGGIQVYRRAEADTVTATKIDAFKKFELRLEDMMGLAYVTGRLLQDSVALQAFIENAFSSAFAFKVDDELVRGTGSGQCLGVLNAPALISQAKETGQAADTVVAENVINMFARMHPRNMGGATWYINAEILPLLMKMYISTGTGGQLVYMPPSGLSGGPYGTLLGRPVEALEHCAAKGDVGDILFADYSDYLVIEKGGVQMAESMHVRFIYDEMTLRFMYRMNGQPKEPAAVTPYKGANTLSAFVALAAR